MDLTAQEQQELAEAQGDPRRRLGPYLLLKELGRGGMGVVFKGFDPRVGRRVAIKLLLDPSAHRLLARFQQEAQLASRLQHPSVAQVFELNTSDPNAPFLVLQYVPGRSLLDRIRAAPGGLTRDAIARWVAQAAEGIAAAHAAGVLHRDLKPANIMITPDDRAVVLDFGLAKAEADPHGLTQTGELVGTVNYMAPELATGEHAVTTSVDVYGLGGVLYECLARQAPYVGASQVNVLSSLIHRPPHSPSKVLDGVDPELEAICLRCLDRDPAQRYADATAVAEALRDLLVDEEDRTAPIEEARASSAPLALLALGALVLVGGIGLFAFAGRTAPDPVSSRQTSEPTPEPSPASTPAPTPSLSPAATPTPAASSTLLAEARATVQRLRAALVAAARQRLDAPAKCRAADARVQALRDEVDAVIARAPERIDLQALGAESALRAFDLRDALERGRAILRRDPADRAAKWVVIVAVAERSLLLRASPGAPLHVLQREREEGLQLDRSLPEESTLTVAVCRSILRGQVRRAQKLLVEKVEQRGASREALYWQALLRLVHTSPRWSDVDRAAQEVFKAFPRDRRMASVALVAAVRRRKGEAVIRGHLRRTGLGPQNAFALVDLATRTRSRAEALLAEASPHLPRDPMIPWARGSLALRTDPAAAIAAFGQALALDPRHHGSLTRRAACYLRRRQYALAEADYRKALELKPGQSRLLINLATTLTHQGKRSEALRLLKEATPGNNTNLLVARGRAFGRLKAPEALVDLTEAIRLLTTRPAGKWTQRSLGQAYYARAEAQVFLGKPAEARADLARVLGSDGATVVHKAYLLRGELRRKEGRHAEAATDFREYLRRVPQDTRTRTALEAYLKRYP